MKRLPRWTWALGVLLVAAAAGSVLVFRPHRGDVAPPPPERVEAATYTYAVLVGCTEYPVLKQSNDLATYESVIRLLGPANDVKLLSEVLRGYLGVPADHIRTLSGWTDGPEGAASNPTRANILDRLAWLARSVPRGGHAFFLFSGHGSQQDDEPGGEEDDHLDEIILPSDTGGADPGSPYVKNVITDDELRRRFAEIRAKGADVCAVFDSCHSGGMARGTPDAPDFGEVRLRGLDPKILGLPPRAAPMTASRGVAARKGFLREDGAHGIAVISAVESWQQAPEFVLPRGKGAEGAAPHGLCAYSVARVLQSHPGELSVGELFRQVQARYAALPWQASTPVLEGDATMRALPTAKGAGSRLVLRRDAGRLVVDAGAVRGLTPGSVIEVYRPDRFGDPTASLGRLTVSDVAPWRSICHAAKGGLAPATLPDGAPSELVSLAPGGRSLRLGFVDAAGAACPDDPARRERMDALLGGSARSLFAFVPPADADWHLRELPIAPDGVARYLLLPAGARAGTPSLEVRGADLRAALERIRRTETLRAFARTGPTARPIEGLKVEAWTRRMGALPPSSEFQAGTVDTDVPFPPGAVLVPGDLVLFQAANETGRDLYATSGFLDADKDLEPVCPSSDDESSKLLTSAANQLNVSKQWVQILGDGAGQQSLLLTVLERAPGRGPLDIRPLTARTEADATGATGDGSAGAAGPPTVGVTGGPADDAAPPGALVELRWTTSWGRVRVPPAWASEAGMLDLKAPAIFPSPPAGVPGPPGRGVVWRRARVIPGHADRAAVLLLFGEGPGPGETIQAILVVESPDAKLKSDGIADAVERLEAGRLPVDVMVVLEAGRISASYPRQAGDAALGVVLVGTPDGDGTRERFDLGEAGWRRREAGGPWLSTSLIPSASYEDGDRGMRIVRSLRPFLSPR